MPSPDKLAYEIAQLLDRDPVMAGQLKEHLKPERLKTLLQLPTSDFDFNGNLLGYVIKKHSLPEVLEAFRIGSVKNLGGHSTK